MPSTILLASSLATDFPTFQFHVSDEFRWSPDDMTIFYDGQSTDVASLLHELSHAVLGHKEYKKDIELIELEQAAWTHAVRELAQLYNVDITDDEIQDSLDTYRDWLHARSTCPHCKATGIQTRKSEYKCFVCGTKWRANEARICALRRYTVK